MSRGAEKTRVPLLMRDRSFYHTFLILAGTLILEQAVVLSVNLADNLMIGSYNETALAAVAAVNQIVFVVQQVIYGVTNGVIVLSSQYWGKQQTAPIRRLVCLGLRLEAALSMLFFAVVSLWPAQCVGLFVTDAAIIAEGVRYLRVIRFTFPFFAVTTVLLGAMRSVETVSLALKVSVVSLVTNCVSNYILIFGKFGFPQLGIAGAAIGSSLSELVSVIFFIIYTWKRIDCKKYALNILPKFQGQTLKRILNVSVWTMIQNFVSLSTWFMFFHFVEHLGERSLAIANIIRNVSGIPFMIAMAFAATCGSLVSNLIGAGEQDCVRGTIRQHIRIGYVFVIPILIFFCLFPDLVLSIYTDMPDLREASIPSLWVLCSAYLVLVPANVYFQSVSGTGNTRTALAMELCVLAIYVTYATYFILYMRMDIAFAWTTESVYGIFILIFCYRYMKKGNWQKKKI